jgi:S1-C subfamily serine protease
VIGQPVADQKKGPIKGVQASYANFVWGIPEETDPLYPELGISTRVREDDKLLEVIDVEKDSPAARAGLKVQDILMTLDGNAIADRETLARIMAGKRWGDAAAFTVRRGAATLAVPVPLRREPHTAISAVKP